MATLSGKLASFPLTNGRPVKSQKHGGRFPCRSRPCAVAAVTLPADSVEDTSSPVITITAAGGIEVQNGTGVRVSRGNEAVSKRLSSVVSVEPDANDAEVAYLSGRAAVVQEHFPSALGADDFMQRLEKALFSFGFTGDNSIAMVNLCRDEVTLTLKQRIEQVFGSSFSTNGLGGVLTCGVTGMGAGFSHSPLCSNNKERYVFFSFPHISVNSRGEVGPMSRPGRTGQSSACGALIKATKEIKSEGLTCNCKIPGVHDFTDPEMSVLKQRIARRLFHEGATDESVQGLTLVDVTKVAERTISDDLEYLISKTVDATKADYAVVTGVQVHNWAYDFGDDSFNLEFVAPTSVYVVVDGVKTHLDVAAMPPMTPRQMLKVAGESTVCERGGSSILRAEEAANKFDSKEARKARNLRLQRYIEMMRHEGTEAEYAATALLQQSIAALAAEDASPAMLSWQSAITLAEPERCATEDNSAAALDVKFAEDSEVLQMKGLLDLRTGYVVAPPQPESDGESSQELQPELELNAEAAIAAADVEEGTKPEKQPISEAKKKRLGELQPDGSILYRNVHFTAGPKRGADGNLIFTLALDD